MLDHRPIRVVNEIDIGWPCRPIIPGVWCDVPSSISAAIAAEGARRGDMRTMLPSPIERMRSLPLGFYPGWFLVEGLARYTINAAGVFRMLIGPDELLLLDGTSPPIHELNIRVLRLENNAAMDQYLRFFCGVVHGDAGPFSIVERMEMLTLNPALGAEAAERVKVAVQPVMRCKGDDVDVRSAAVVYGAALFRSRFKVRPSGMVEMLDDDLVEPNVLERASTYDGIWAVFEEPTNGVRRSAS